MSPVPPAMSSMVQPWEGVVEEEPGLRPRTKWSLLKWLALCSVMYEENRTWKE